MSKGEQKEVAEQLFCRKGMTLKAISKAVKVSERTLGRWRAEENWDEKKRAHEASWESIAGEVREICQKKITDIKELSAREINTKTVDMLSKMVKSIASMQREVSPAAEAVVVMERFTAFILEEKLGGDFKERLSNLMDRFLDREFAAARQ